MTRTYNKNESVCLGECGRLLSPRRRVGEKGNKGEAYRHAKGMCWPCYRDSFSVVRHEPAVDKVRWARIEYDAYIARRRRLGIPAEGKPVTRRAA